MNYGDQIRLKSNEELAKFLACEVCRYSEDCNAVFEFGHESCDGLYKAYKKYLDREIERRSMND